MDRSTHEIRLASWKTVVEQCNSRPQGISVKQWLAANSINEKTYYYWLRRVRHEVYTQMQQELPVLQETKVPAVAFAEIPVPDTCKTEDISFKADIVIRYGFLVIGIANSVSESLLSKVLEGVVMLAEAAGVKRIIIACGRTDLRKGIDGLSQIIGTKYDMNSFEKDVLFLFCGGRGDRIKGLLWEGNGYLLLYKRLEDGSFSWPRTPDEALQLTEDQYTMLMMGLNPIKPKIRNVNPKKVC